MKTLNEIIEEVINSISTSQNFAESQEELDIKNELIDALILLIKE